MGGGLKDWRELLHGAFTTRYVTCQWEFLSLQLAAKLLFFLSHLLIHISFEIVFLSSLNFEPRAPDTVNETTDKLN